MLVLLIILLVVTTLITVGLVVGITLVRKKKRLKIDTERTLQMVTLLIHLPPPSEDLQVGGRDIRDVADENISKAQTMYKILSSTYQKDKKAKVYGQKHLSFEIVVKNGFVYYYTVCPIDMVAVVQQAVIGAYPTARVEEVDDYNIFNPVGGINGVLGGEIVLKEDYAYPIATYQEIKRETMQSLLNALSTLGQEDGASIQILIRPSGNEWRKHGSAMAGKKKKGKDKKSKGSAVAGNFLKSLAQSFIKAPEQKDKSGDKPLSSIDQAIVDAMEEKTKHQGFEVKIRLIASSNISQRSKAILENILATFSLFEAPGRNGLKLKVPKNIELFTRDFIMRSFPTADKKMILNSVELSTIYHFPDQHSTPTSQLQRQTSKQVDGPREMPDEGLFLGFNEFRGSKKKITLGYSDRQRHVYIVGQTGTGKSWFMESLLMQDVMDNRGFAFIDPHGDTAEKILSMIPPHRANDVIYFNPADMDNPIGLNLFEYDKEDQKDFIIQETINMLYKLYDPQKQGIIGPRYEQIFRNTARTVMADPEGGTFIDIPKLFNDQEYLRAKLMHVKDQDVLDFWNKELPDSSRSNDFGEVKAWFVAKFGAFLSNNLMRNIIGQTKSGFNFRQIMDEGKILIVNLNRFRTGALNTQLLGMILVMKFQAAAMSRVDIPENQRRDFCLFVDEFQNFSTDSFSAILAEARKFKLNIIVANQSLTQLTDDIRNAIIGNVGSLISFRVGTEDVKTLTEYFKPVFESEDILRLPNYTTICRILIKGVPSQPFSMSTVPFAGTPNKEVFDALVNLSGQRFGVPRAVVEGEFNRRMSSTAPAGPSNYNPVNQGSPQPPQPKSFMDEWASRRSDQPSSNSQYVNQPAYQSQTPNVAINNQMPGPSNTTQPIPQSMTVPAYQNPTNNQVSQYPNSIQNQPTTTTPIYDASVSSSLPYQINTPISNFLSPTQPSLPTQPQQPPQPPQPPQPQLHSTPNEHNDQGQLQPGDSIQLH